MGIESARSDACRVVTHDDIQCPAANSHPPKMGDTIPGIDPIELLTPMPAHTARYYRHHVNWFSKGLFAHSLFTIEINFEKVL